MSKKLYNTHKLSYVKEFKEYCEQKNYRDTLKVIDEFVNRVVARERQRQTYYATENEDGDRLSYIDTIAGEDAICPQNLGDPLEIVRKDYEEYLIDEISKTLSDMEQMYFYQLCQLQFQNPSL